MPPCHNRVLAALLFASVATFAAPKGSNKPPRFMPTEMKAPMSGFQEAGATAINADGELTVNWSRADGSSTPFLQSGSGATALPFASPQQAVARGMNESGQVVGDVIAPFTARRMFRWEAGTGMTTMPAGDNSFGYAINSYGDCVGEYWVSNQGRGFLWDRRGTLVDLGTLGGETIAYGVNATEQVTGVSTSADGIVRAFVWSPGQEMHAIFGGTDSSVAYAINDAGQIAGSLHTKQGWKAIVYSTASDTYTVFPSLTPKAQTFAQAINANGVAGGQSDGRAALFLNGNTYDLNDLTTMPAGWTLTIATGINANGEIAAVATNTSGETRAYLLKPIN
jgi:probable HAF family extracellular repeat protein